ncbi:MAG: hypothetical protein ABSC16_01625 [Candidatus Dormibacteria bacterium]|nr:hypothetical protein [Chloroflexota bacterium]HBV94769.1 hypothetical protein [Chloroflexota bacterium]
MVAVSARQARCHPQPAVVDNVCTGCWRWFPGTARTCPGCGAPLTPSNAAAASPALADPPRPPAPAPAAAVAAPPRSHRLLWVLVFTIVLSFAMGIFPLPQLGLWGNPGCSFPGATCTRVLFIGNSYTSVNDLPDTFADLAWAGGHRVQTQALDEGGWTLQEHLAAPETATTLASEHWDVVVLQEQSQIPSLAVDRTQMMYPAATGLVAEIRARDAQPMLYLTFAHQDGWPEEGLADYPTMQTAIDTGYLGIADQLSVPVAPVGVAWEAVVGQASHPALWESDGSHPTASGTYLAACVFYATIFRESPVGLGDDGGLPASEAHDLQAVAAATVLGDPTEWGLPA